MRLILQTANGEKRKGEEDECWGGRGVTDWLCVCVCVSLFLFCMANSSQTFSVPRRASGVWRRRRRVLPWSFYLSLSLHSYVALPSLHLLSLPGCHSIPLPARSLTCILTELLSDIIKKNSYCHLCLSLSPSQTETDQMTSCRRDSKEPRVVQSINIA